MNMNKIIYYFIRSVNCAGIKQQKYSLHVSYPRKTYIVGSKKGSYRFTCNIQNTCSLLNATAKARDCR